jgi:hypothetical protein
MQRITQRSPYTKMADIIANEHSQYSFFCTTLASVYIVSGLTRYKIEKGNGKFDE